MLQAVSSVCVGMVALLTGCALAYVDTSNGAGTGVQCGGIKCAQFASCTPKKRCVCDTAPYDNGNGYLYCHTSDYMSTFIMNDPQVWTLEGETADLPLPCRYQVLMSDTTFLDDEGNNLGICWFDINAFNRKDKGKFYLHGFDAAVHTPIVDPATGVKSKMSVRKVGIARSGNYEYEINATRGQHSTDGPFEDDVIDFYDAATGLRMMECNLDKENNIAMINVSHCGTWLYFRAYDIEARRSQAFVPGVAIVFKKDQVRKIYEKSHHTALTPGKITMADLPPATASNTTKMVARVLPGKKLQNNPDPNPNCNPAGDSLGMSDMEKALDNCLWMLQSPKFIRCYDNTQNGEHIMLLFKGCVDVVNASKSCSSVQHMVNNPNSCEGSDPGNDDLYNFMNSPTCEV